MTDHKQALIDLRDKVKAGEANIPLAIEAVSTFPVKDASRLIAESIFETIIEDLNALIAETE